MADQETDILVALEPDDKTTKIETVETGESNDLATQFKTLQAENERNRIAREAADRRAGDATRQAALAREEAESARTEVVAGQADTIASGLTAAKAEAEAGETDYRAAMEAGDWAAAAKAQRRMSAAEARIVRLDEAKDDVEQRQKVKPAPRQQQEVQRTTDDPVEAYVSKLTPKSAEWLRGQDPSWVTDQRKNAKLVAAHHMAIADGISPETPEYFESLEKSIGLKAQTDGTNGNTPPRQTRKAAPVAPVTASAGGTNGGGKEVRLSQGEARAATDGTHVWNYDDPSGKGKFKKGDPIGTQEFARRKLAMQAEGRYDRTFTES